MEEQKSCKELTGKALVDAVFLDRLESEGLVKSARVKQGEHQAFIKKLRDKLAYMNEESLRRLADLVLPMAGGAAHNVWPGFATVWNLATRVQMPPDRENPIMQSWLGSVEGPKLRDAGVLLETYVTLRRIGRPLGPFEEREVAERSKENARKREIVLQRVASGSASADEEQWLEWYDRLSQHCIDLVKAGEAKRASKVEA